MTWLLRDGDVLAAAEVADGFADRTKGLLGRTGYEGAIVFPRDPVRAHLRDALSHRRRLL